MEQGLAQVESLIRAIIIICSCISLLSVLLLLYFIIIELS